MAIALAIAFVPVGKLPFGEALVLVPGGALLGGLGVALALRMLRGRLGSSAAALASNAWALLGLLPATVVVGWIALTRNTEVLQPKSWSLTIALLASVVLGLYGHIALVDPLRRVQAGRAIRHGATGALTAALVVGGALFAEPFVPREAVARGAFLFAGLVAAVLVYRATYPAVRRVLAPYGGRLLDGVRDALDALGAASSLDEVGAAVLPALRQASGSTDARPSFFLVDPPTAVRIDAAGQVHVVRRSMPTALAARLQEHPGEVILRSELEDRVVRRAELRGVVEALVELDAVCVVPLMTQGECEGVLAVPRGSRRTPLSLEELGALQRLGLHLAGLLALVSGQLRAQRRATTIALERDRTEERLEAAEEELMRLRAQTKILRAGRGFSRVPTTAVAYSATMRRLDQQIGELAPLEAPVLMIAEVGVAVDEVAQRIHDRSSRQGGPFVVVDCTQYRPEDSEGMLFGIEADPASPGWVRLAHGGTLTLKDVPALSLAAQQALAEAISTRMARSVGGAGAYNLDVRIIATSRAALEPLIEAGAFHEELGRWLGKLQIAAPALRQRREDLPSLILLSIDRACRRLGRPPLGIDPNAVDLLVAYSWPGNVQELDQVVDRAVALADQGTIQPHHLPAIAQRDSVDPPPTGETLEGTYEDIERRAMLNALERANGNKSRAARLLGLKRTTFLDKLRKLQLDDSDADAQASDSSADADDPALP